MIRLDIEQPTNQFWFVKTCFFFFRKQHWKIIVHSQEKLIPNNHLNKISETNVLLWKFPFWSNLLPAFYFHNTGNGFKKRICGNSSLELSHLQILRIWISSHETFFHKLVRWRTLYANVYVCVWQTEKRNSAHFNPCHGNNINFYKYSNIFFF